MWVPGFFDLSFHMVATKWPKNYSLVHTVHIFCIPICHCMLPRLSDDLQAHIPVLCYEQYCEVKEICQVLGIKKSVVYESLKHFRCYGFPSEPNHSQTRTASYSQLNRSQIYPKYCRTLLLPSLPWWTLPWAVDTLSHSGVFLNTLPDHVTHLLFTQESLCWS